MGTPQIKATPSRGDLKPEVSVPPDLCRTTFFFFWIPFIQERERTHVHACAHAGQGRGAEGERQADSALSTDAYKVRSQNPEITT